jgi:hypothetical protein
MKGKMTIYQFSKSHARFSPQRELVLVVSIALSSVSLCRPQVLIMQHDLPWKLYVIMAITLCNGLDVAV